jgi:hypothetical protein
VAGPFGSQFIPEPANVFQILIQNATAYQSCMRSHVGHMPFIARLLMCSLQVQYAILVAPQNLA